jgi:hypothetical protein
MRTKVRFTAESIKDRLYEINKGSMNYFSRNPDRRNPHKTRAKQKERKMRENSLWGSIKSFPDVLIYSTHPICQAI